MAEVSNLAQVFLDQKQMEVVQQVKEELADLNHVLLQMIFADGPDLDPDYDKYAKRARVMALFDVFDIAESQKKTLKVQGRTLKSMTMEDWYWHFANVGPPLVSYLMSRFMTLSYSFMSTRKFEDACMRQDVEYFEHLHYEFKLFAKKLTTKTHGCIFLVVDFERDKGDRYELPTFMYLVAIMMTFTQLSSFCRWSFNLIIESQNHCSSIEKMRRWVIEKIDGRCDEFFAQYNAYLEKRRVAAEDDDRRELEKALAEKLKHDSILGMHIEAEEMLLEDIPQLFGSVNL